MKKVVLFDIDGVLIIPTRYFSEKLEKMGYANAVSILISYYQSNEDELCCEGKLNIEEEIKPYLAQIGWKKSSTEYLNESYEFEKGDLNSEIIDLIIELRKKGIICCIATDQNQHRANYLLENLKFKKIFDYHFISSKIGCKKGSQEFWEYLRNFFSEHHPDITTSEMLFFDDRYSNLEAAANFSIPGELVEEKEKFRNDVQSLLA